MATAMALATRRHVPGGALALTLAACASTAAAAADKATPADFVGTWDITIQASDGEHRATLTFTKDKDTDTLKGEHKGETGTHPVKDAAVKDGTLEFRVDSTFNGEDLLLEYAVRLEDGALKGEVAYEIGESSGSFPVAGKRVKPIADQGKPAPKAPKPATPAELDAIAGSWELEFTAPDDNLHRPTLVLNRDGDRLKGSLNKLAGADLPAEDVALEDGGLTFRVRGKHEGVAYTLTFRGTPEGDTLKGSVAYEYEDDSGAFPFKGKRTPKADAPR